MNGFYHNYSLKLKQTGFSKDFNNFIIDEKKNTFFRYKRYWKLILKLKKLRINFEVINYSRYKDNIFEIFAQKSDIKYENLEISKKFINTSLDLNNLEKIIYFNTYIDGNKDIHSSLKRHELFNSDESLNTWNKDIKIFPIKKFYIYLIPFLYFDIFKINLFLKPSNKLRCNFKKFFRSFFIVR